MGIEIRITRLEGKWKLNQNKAPADAFGVVNGLRAAGGEANNAMADLGLEVSGSKSLTD